MIVNDEIFEEQIQRLINNCENPEEGLFGPKSMMWKMSREIFLSIDGVSVFCLQISHPSIAKALTFSGGYNKNPNLRFQQTRDLIGDLIFGDLDTAIETSRKIYKIHKNIAIKGFDTNSSELIIWVASCMVFTRSYTYRKLIGSLTEEEEDLYIKDFIKLLSCFGISEEEVPNNWNEFQKYFIDKLWGHNNNNNFLVVTDESKKLLDSILNSYWFLRTRLWKAIIAWSVPPAYLQKSYGLYYDDYKLDNKVEKFLYFVKVIIKYAPKYFRFFPAYNKAMKRIALTKKNNELY